LPPAFMRGVPRRGGGSIATQNHDRRQAIIQPVICFANPENAVHFRAGGSRPSPTQSIVPFVGNGFIRSALPPALVRGVPRRGGGSIATQNHDRRQAIIQPVICFANPENAVHFRAGGSRPSPTQSIVPFVGNGFIRSALPPAFMRGVPRRGGGRDSCGSKALSVPPSRFFGYFLCPHRKYRPRQGPEPKPGRSLIPCGNRRFSARIPHPSKIKDF